MKNWWNKRTAEDKQKVALLALAALLLLGAKLLTGFGVDSLVLYFYLAAYVIASQDVFKEAYENIKKGSFFDEHTLMIIATLGAISIKQYPEAVFVMLFYQIGDFFEDMAVSDSRQSIKSLLDIRPDTAKLKNGPAVAPKEVKVGDIIEVAPGEKIPLDGVVVSGKAYLNTAALTGESKPLAVTSGDQVLSGMICQNAPLDIKVEKSFHESTVVKILQMVEDAGDKKAPTEKFITKFAQIYTPLVVAAAVLLAVLPPLLFQFDFQTWLYRALVFLVISCPCALVLSIPLSFFSGIGAASKAGVLVKGGDYLEALNQVKTFVFDKTGTLTKGEFEVVKVMPQGGMTAAELVKLAAICEQKSPHPIAKSICQYYPGNIETAEIEELVGKGVSAVYQGQKLYCGSQRLIEEVMGADVLLPKPQTGTLVHLATKERYLGSLEVADVLKPTTKQTMHALKEAGANLVMLTGDNRQVGLAVADELGMDEVKAELLPQDKVKEVQKLKAKLGQKEKLAFVGDGLNDTPVLAQSDVGIAMGALGSDAAVEAADIVLMSDDPLSIVKAFKISQKTKQIVWENISFALGVKVICLILGALGLADMWQAVFADVGVTCLAVLNSLRILRK